MHDEEIAKNSSSPLQRNSEDTTDNDFELVLGRIAENDPEAAQVITTHMMSSKSYQGPMPSPEDIQNYALTQADFPERMMTMAERAQENGAKHAEALIELRKNEIHLELVAINSDSSIDHSDTITQRLGMLISAFVATLCISGSFYLALQDKTEVALAIGGTTVVGIIASLLKGKGK